MRATTKPNPPRRPVLLRRLAAALALAALLLLGAMTSAAVAAPRAPAVHKDVAPAAQPLPTSRPSAAILPLVLGGIILLAVVTPFPAYYPRYGYRGGGRY